MTATARLAEPSLYERDFAAWTDEQARLLKERRWSEVDIENLIEEVDSLGRDQKGRIASHTSTILVHLLKLAASPSREPERGWVETVLRARAQLADRLADNPSLATDAAFLPVLARQHERARQEVRVALAQYGELTPESERLLREFRAGRDELLAIDWFPPRPGA